MSERLLKKRHLDPMEWGSAPELIGPRHLYRVDRLARALAKAVPHGTVLDAGCGAGALSERLARMGYEVVAIDGSWDFMAHTKERLFLAGVGHRARVMQGDLQQLDLEEASLDAAVCGDVLEHLPDDEAAVAGIARALRSGGAFALTVPAGAQQYDWLDAWAGHERRYDEEALRALLTGAGLRIDYVKRWGFPFMAIYERFVQRPGLAHTSRGAGSEGKVARLARSRTVTMALGCVFHLDQLFEGRNQHGTGFLALARKP